jgi:hypothetical protein
MLYLACYFEMTLLFNSFVLFTIVIENICYIVPVCDKFLPVFVSFHYDHIIYVTGNSPEDGAVVAGKGCSVTLLRLDLVECDLENQGESGIVVGWWPSAYVRLNTMLMLRHHHQGNGFIWLYLCLFGLLCFPVIEMVNLWYSYVCFHICLW